MSVAFEKQLDQNSEVVQNLVVEADERIQMESTVVDVSTVSSDDDMPFQDIVMLLDYGIDELDIIKFKKAGINTIKGIQMTMKKNLKEIGFDEIKIDKILEICGQLDCSTGFMTAIELSNIRQQIFRLSTGSKRLNTLFGGGIEAMSITEVFGEFGSGKTQLAHTLCVTAQMPGDNGYVGGKVIFIDTEHTFRPDRLRPIADRFNLNQTKVLENVLYARAYNSEHQYNLLNNVATKMHQEPGIFKLLIVDSIMALFRVDYTGMGELVDRQTKLGKMLSRLQKMSEEYNIAVLITNQIVSDFSAIKEEAKPIGGHIMAHSSTTRVALKKGVGNRRYAHMFDSPELEAEETKFAITTGGIDDIKDIQN